MAINQTILTPLTLFSGSLSSHTVAAGATQGRLMGIISSSLPVFNAPFWNYKIKTQTSYFTSATAQNINELQVPLNDTNNYFLIVGYFGIGCSSTTNPPRFGSSLSNAGDASYYYEIPSSLTNTYQAWQTTTGPQITTWPSSDVNNFYLTKFVLIGKPNTAAGTYAPTLAVSSSGAGITSSMGPSVVYWTKIQ